MSSIQIATATELSQWSWAMFTWSLRSWFWHMYWYITLLKNFYASPSVVWPDALCFTSNVPGPRPGTFTPAQRPGRYRGCSVLRYLRPINLAASFAAATETAGVTAATTIANQRAARSANQRLRWWPTYSISIILRWLFMGLWVCASQTLLTQTLLRIKNCLQFK